MRQRDVFQFWLPLFASWWLMASEGPIVSSAINRLPGEEIMMAAFGIVLAIAIFVEAPVINLLSTSTALVKERHSYLLVRKFTLQLSVVLTGVMLLINFTPLFEWIVYDLLGTPAEVGVHVKTGLRNLTLWTAAIGWRRFLQGILIHFGETGKVARGTVVRLTASAGSAFLLAALERFSGIFIGSAALMAGVAAEALYITGAARPVIRDRIFAKKEVPREDPLEPHTPLTYDNLFRFHLPLAASSLLVLLSHPFITFALARLEHPTLSLAAWPILFQILMMSRAASLALPEVVIAVTRPDTYHAIRRFTRNLAFLSVTLLALFTFTSLSGSYLFQVQDTKLAVGRLVRENLWLFLLVPGMTAFTNWLRGLLIHHRRTLDVNTGIAINLFSLTIALALSLHASAPGIRAAAYAINSAVGLEMLFLFFRTSSIRNGYRFRRPPSDEGSTA